MNIRDTIKEITRKHSAYGYHCYGQCLTAVGWVGGTLPELYEEDRMIELSMADVAGGGIVVGAALMGKRPIYVVRYQGFQWFNSPIILNYAAKSKEIWKQPCPIFIRSIAMEGGIGPVAGSSHHGIYFRMPGVKIISPMTPKEYQYAYDNFIKNDDVMYVSEHRKSYDNELELEDHIRFGYSDITLLPFSITRFAAIEAKKKLEEMGYKINIIHQLWIKPFFINHLLETSVCISKYGALITDDDYEYGIANNIAHQIMLKTNKRVETLCIDNRTAGFHKDVDNLPPSADKIVQKCLQMMGK